jgi:TRAP-type mannitol/chloroaromatic compound transport system permease small subunit
VGGLIRLSRTIDKFSVWVGETMSWLIVAAVLVSSVNAVVRKLFDMSSNAWLELQWVLFSAVFLLCASWALASNAHVRIDIVNALLPRRVRNAIEVGGTLVFLLPLTIVMMITSLPFVMSSVRINEQSASAGGLPQWPAKTLVFLGFAMLFVQALSELIKSIAIMAGLLPDAAAPSLHSPTEPGADPATPAADANDGAQR